jgi:hypothetical protein
VAYVPYNVAVYWALPEVIIHFLNYYIIGLNQRAEVWVEYHVMWAVIVLWFMQPQKHRPQVWIPFLAFVFLRQFEQIVQQRANLDPDETRKFEEIHWMLNSDNLTVLGLALFCNNFIET